MRLTKGLIPLFGLILAGLGQMLMHSSPSSGQEAPAAKPREIWGPTSGGLKISIAISGEVVYRGAFAPTLMIRNDSDRSVRLPASKEVFAWLLISQKATDGSRRDMFSDKVYIVFNSTDWPHELAAGQTLEVKPADFSGTAVFPFSEGIPVKDGFPDTQPSASYARGLDALGRFADIVSIGLTSCRLMLCLPGMEGTEPLMSNSLGILVAPMDLKTLISVDKDMFIADLMRQFNGDAEAASAASRTTIRFGSQVMPQLVATVKETGHSTSAKQWLIRTLAEIPDERTVDPLIGYLDDSQADVRLTAAYWCPRQRSDRLDGTLIEKAASTDEIFKAKALLGFLVFRGIAPAKLLKAGLDSDNPTERAASLSAIQEIVGKADLARLRQLVDSSDVATANAVKLVLQSKKTVASNWTEGGKYTILLNTFSGDNHQTLCTSFQRKLVADTGWDKTYVLSLKEKGCSYLCWGRFVTIQAAQKSLEQAKAYRTPSGMALFAQAKVIEYPILQSTQPSSE